MEGIVETGCLFGVLSMLAIEDGHKQKIPVLPVVLCGIAGVIFHLMFERITVMDMLGGFLIGLFLLFLSLYTRGKIGKGDGILLMATGVYLGFWNNLLLLWMASCMAGIFGIGVCIKRRKWRGTRLPFVPFLFLAFCLILIMQKGVLS